MIQRPSGTTLFPYTTLFRSMETLLVHEAVAARLLPQLADAYREKGVELRGCEKSRALVADMKVATEDDWREEYLAPILAVKIVADIDGAMDHISQDRKSVG